MDDFTLGLHFSPVYCVSLGKFTMIEQIIGLKRAYLFNYFSFCERTVNPGFSQLCIIPGFLLQIKFVIIMNRNNKDCTLRAMNKSCFNTSGCAKDMKQKNAKIGALLLKKEALFSLRHRFLYIVDGLLAFLLLDAPNGHVFFFYHLAVCDKALCVNLVVNVSPDRRESLQENNQIRIWTFLSYSV